MSTKITPSQRTWLSAFIPSLIILIAIAVSTYSSTGAMSGSSSLNRIFWLLLAVCLVSFAGFVVSTVWPSKKERLKARKRRRKRRKAEVFHAQAQQRFEHQPRPEAQFEREPQS